MAYDYDALYASTPQALGTPSPIFADFFSQYDGPPLRVLDIGCGQGRDALFIARLGHSVIGVDLSPNGIREMVDLAKAENLNVEGIVADITAYTHTAPCNVLLIDRTLHMLPKADQLNVLAHLTALSSATATPSSRMRHPILQGSRASLRTVRMNGKRCWIKRETCFLNGRDA